MTALDNVDGMEGLYVDGVANAWGIRESIFKLTYKAKDGSFKGSFKVYSDVNGKLKATSVSVTGVQIGNKGYGVATIKGKGSIPVTVE